MPSIVEFDSASTREVEHEMRKALNKLRHGLAELEARGVQFKLDGTDTLTLSRLWTEGVAS